MNRNIISKLENLIKDHTKDTYYEYLRILHLYKYFIGNIQEFTPNDRLEILSFFYESVLGDVENIYSKLETTDSFIFKGDKFREKNFRMALEYFRNRYLFSLSNEESIDLIEKNNTFYSPSLIEFLRRNARTLDEVFNFNEHRFRDKLESLPTEKDFYRIYSDDYSDIIIIRKNFFSDLNPSFFSRDGLIIRFCETGQIGFEKDAMFLNEREALLSKGISLGDYKVLTQNISYVTLHIKDKFFKDFQIDFPEYVLKKLPWKLDSPTLYKLDNLISFKNSKIIMLNFITDIVLSFLGEEHRLDFNRVTNKELKKIVAFIDYNIDNDLSVAQIKREFGLNKNNLASLFNNNLEMSPTKYIINKKLEKASKLLLESDLSVTDIAFKLNFSSGSKFSSHFKKKYSLTPLQFKKKFEKLIRR
ncbi:AraC family transcriptional regulator [uncultured Ilyobacter sp.]|uniref:helix-turn-helix transcriptional regulator n=1 Tax=uncultured Ilyobacter sp. TaxID=544433 RepID=UPI0029BFB856|nr:AraC family transcriptional regulator [uncultured Ilyobacter sp.]